MPHEIEASYELRMISIERPINFGPIPGPTVTVSIKYENSIGKQYEKYFTIKSGFTFLPDSMGASDNPISQQFFSSDNLRGIISFFVNEAKNAD